MTVHQQIKAPQKHMHSVQFIIVNYNSGSWLARAIISIFEYCPDLDFKIYVVDNASIDNSIDLAQNTQYANDIEWVLNTQNVGFAAANNQVLDRCDADFVVLMNPDCELLDRGIPSILSAFDKNPRLGLASCRILNEDGSIQATCRRRFPTPMSALSRMLLLYKLFPNNKSLSNFDYGSEIVADQTNQNFDDKIIQVEAISGAFMVARQSAIKEVGLLDEGYFMHCEDLDWCKRFEINHWLVVFFPSVAIRHAKGVSSKSRPIRVLWTLHKGMNRFFDKFYQQSYSWPVRYLVKFGIFMSFTLRAGVALVRSVLKRG